jgi:hypothetical protein
VAGLGDGYSTIQGVISTVSQVHQFILPIPLLPPSLAAALLFLQLRLPSLLATNVLLLIAGAARQTIFCKVGLEWVVRAVGPRLCAVAIGVALDLRRRALFMREQLSAARKTAAPGECQ